MDEQTQLLTKNEILISIGLVKPLFLLQIQMILIEIYSLQDQGRFENYP